MNGRFYRISALALFIWGACTLAFSAYAQTAKSERGDTGPAEMGYSLSLDTRFPIPVSTMPQGETMSLEKRQLLQQLDRARRSNDVRLAAQLNAKLCAMDGSVTMPLQQANGLSVIEMPPPSGNQSPARITGNALISNVPNWSMATATTPSTGRLWVTLTQYAPSTDTVRTYFSDDRGQNWTLYNTWNFAGSVHFRPGELDIEVVDDGASVWLFGVVGATNALAGSKPFCQLFRFNTTTRSFFSTALNWPGFNVTGNSLYNPRIASDNSVYSATTEVFMIASFDSTLTDSTKLITQKFAVMLSPFDPSPAITYRSPSPTGLGFYWYTSSAPTNTYLYGDIAYYNNGDTNRIMTVYNYQPSPILYLAWSEDYGSTYSGATFVSDTQPIRNARLAFNGGDNNVYGMIVELRLFSGVDWDTRYYNTSTGGTGTGSWTGGYIDFTSRISRSCDVVGVRGGANLFKAATVVDTNAFYAGFDGYSWSLPIKTAVNSSRVDSLFGTARAGYALGGGDDGFAIWAGWNGVGVYAFTGFLASQGPWIRTGLGLGPTYAVAVDPTNSQIVYAGSNTTGIYKSIDGGHNFGQISTGLLNTSVLSLAVAPSNPAILYCGAGAGNSNTGVYVSSNAGASWTLSNNGITDTSLGIQAIAVNPTNPNVAYVAVFNGTSQSAVGLYKTVNGGTSWIASNTGVGLNKNFLSIAINPLNPAVLYAGTSFISGVDYPHMYKSVNSGSTWVEISNGLPTTLDPIRVLSISNHDTATVLAGLLMNDTLGGAYLTANGGLNWTQVHNGLPLTVTAHVRSALIRPGSASEFYVGLGGSSAGTGGVYRSTDAGGSWTDISGGDLANSYIVRGLGYVPETGRVFAAGASSDTLGQGVFMYQSFPTAVHEGQPGIPVAAQLYQNYPNPFNPATTIRYALSRSAKVSLTIYNILGQTVATLVNGEIPAGTHEVRWDAGKVASGMYFYRIETKDFVKTMKLLLIR